MSELLIRLTNVTLVNLISDIDVDLNANAYLDYDTFGIAYAFLCMCKDALKIISLMETSK